MNIDKNAIKIIPMNWDISNMDIWGKPNQYTAIDDFLYNQNKSRIYIRYDVGETFCIDGTTKFYVMAQFPNYIYKKYVPYIEIGKEILELKRKEFWESFIKAIIKNILGDLNK